jgi:glycosyltransferase involved in cell wall biosynthesis
MKTPLNIIVITEDYPPASGGIAQWAYGIVQELIALGHCVTVLTRASIFKIENFKYSGETIVKMKSENWNSYRSVYIAYYLLKQIFKQKPDMVIASAWNIGAFATSIKSLFGYKTVLAYHGLEVTKKLSLTEEDVNAYFKWKKASFLPKYLDKVKDIKKSIND